MRPIRPWQIAAWVAIAYLAFGPEIALPAIPWLPIGVAAPFKTDKLSVLIVEETEQRGQLPLEQLGIIDGTSAGSVRQWVSQQGGDLRVLDVSQTPTRELAWVQDAWKAKGDKLPWIVAANSRTGFTKPLPVTTSDTLAMLKPLGGKP